MDLLNSPGFLSGRSTVGSDVSYIFAVLFTGLFLGAGYLARKKRGLVHHRMILASMTAMSLYFVYYYLVRRLGFVSLTDQIVYPGSQWEYSHVFRPILILHFIAVTFSSFFAIYMIVNGFRTAVRTEEGVMELRDGRLGISLVAWGVSVVWLGILLWFLFAFHSFSWGHKITFLAMGYFIPAGIALLIQKALPFSERRHRVLGKICLILFALLLLTSTLTYSLLYVR